MILTYNSNSQSERSHFLCAELSEYVLFTSGNRCIIGTSSVIIFVI